MRTSCWFLHTLDPKHSSSEAAALTGRGETGCVCVSLLYLGSVAVLEHFRWGGKGGARGHARVAWEGGQYVVLYTVYIYITIFC